MIGDRPFLRAPAVATQAYADSFIEYSYSDALELVAGLIQGYRSLGVAPGDRVALAFDSRLDVYLHLLALNALAASMVPLNMGGSDAEVDYILGHSDARLVTGAKEHHQRLESLCHQVDGIEIVAASEIQGEGKPTEPLGDGETEVALMYTSGTTGKPKGCMLSNEYFLTMGREYNTLGGYCDISHSDRLLTPLPPNHMNALSTSFMAMLMCGGCVIQLDRFHPRMWWQTVRDERASIIHYLGVMPAILLTLPEQDGEDFGEHVRFGFGAGCDPRHQEVFESRFGFPLIEAWAMTETGGAGMIVASNEPRHVGQRCFGAPKPQVEVRVVDESDQDVAVGEDGELLVRCAGPDPRKGFFSGYYKDPTATEKGWAGGWWHTGDVVRQDENGSLFFVDRRKNVIRRSGENIAAVEVEAVLMQHEAVANCAVTAVADEIRGDEVFALVVVSGDILDGSMLAKELFDHCMQSMSYFKAPAYISYSDELPLTASQKVNRAEIKNVARAVLESQAFHDFRHLKRRTSS